MSLDLEQEELTKVGHTAKPVVWDRYPYQGFQ